VELAITTFCGFHNGTLAHIPTRGVAPRSKLCSNIARTQPAVPSGRKVKDSGGLPLSKRYTFLFQRYPLHHQSHV
jgi:hypothetical protein